MSVPTPVVLTQPQMLILRVCDFLIAVQFFPVLETITIVHENWDEEFAKSWTREELVDLHEGDKMGVFSVYQVLQYHYERRGQIHHDIDALVAIQHMTSAQFNELYE
jgi:hypothetical protein